MEMRFFSVLPTQQRQRSTTESSVVRRPTAHSRIHDDEASETQRRRRTGESPRRPATDAVSSSEEQTKIFMVVPVRLRDIDPNNPTCLICQEDYQIDCTISLLPCGHLYHARCINGWLKRKSTCCVCRYELPIVTPTTGEGDLRQYLHKFQNEIPEHRWNSINPLADTTTLTYKVS